MKPIKGLVLIGLSIIALAACQPAQEEGPSTLMPEPIVATERVTTIVFARDNCTVYMIEDRGGNTRLYVATTAAPRTCSLAAE